MIYCRTRLGKDTLVASKPGAAGISGDEMRVMLLIDGKASVGEITRKLPLSVHSYLDEIFSRLLISRFIEATNKPTMEMGLKVSSRISHEEVQASLMSSQKLNKNMLVLAEIEIERRMELEQDLADANAKLLATQTLLDEVKTQFEAEADKYQTLKRQVLVYKQGMEARMIALQEHLAKVSCNRQEQQAERVEIENDLKRMRDDFEQMQAEVEEKKATLNETLRLRVLQEQRAEEEKRKQLKIQADEMVRTHPHYNLLRRLSFFKDFRNSEIAQFLIYAQWREVKAGEVVVAEGEDDFLFYVIVTGKLAVMKGKKTLHIFHAGEPFGEIAYMDDENPLRSASIVARTDGLLLVFNPAYLDEAEVIFRMRVAEAFVRIQAGRLRRAVEMVNNLLAD